MSELILIEGDSGVGKTTSMRNLDPDETFYINVSGKPMPLPGWKSNYSPQIKVGGKSDINDINEENGNYAETNKSSAICAIMKYVSSQRDDISQIVIDDFQYMSAFEFFERAGEKGWDKFNEIGQHIFEVFNVGRNLRDDLKVVIMTHTQEEGGEFDKNVSMKTIGKMIDRKLTPEGLCTVVFYADYNPQEDNREDAYYFQTQTDGTVPAKSPMGMFEDDKIPNDLDTALDKIDEYYHG